jgi:hypothetical protein
MVAMIEQREAEPTFALLIVRTKSQSSPVTAFEDAVRNALKLSQDPAWDGAVMRMASQIDFHIDLWYASVDDAPDWGLRRHIPVEVCDDPH